ncbi:MAG: AAA family ATPase [Clostridium botulinum]|nr:AAA family ATPase [Clostridium botulinum]MDU5118077.1 AAA family ATPase [Clostridium botulinum]
MIHSIEINDFRALKNVKIKLGKYITAISGRNGLGKSTILALIGNTCELKGKKTVFNTNFRTEFSEIFKASQQFDLSGSNKCKINFSSKETPSNINETKICRISWQDNGTRFRVIPETKTKEQRNSRKKEWPSLYLGLSRLYPIGEVKDDQLNIKNVKLTEEEGIFFKENYINILNLKTITSNTEEICVDIIDIGNNSRKKGVGVSTSNYSSTTNSAGQDNIGQIIMGIISFKRLSKSYPNYKGGLLLIDEIEATLHPIAQIKLIKFLYRSCKELNLQVVFTTHSVSLLEDLSLKVLYNDEMLNNNYEIYYLTKNNGPLNVLRNPDFPIIKSDLTLSQPGVNISRISVYSEDDETRWFFNKLIGNNNIYVKNIKIKLSCDALLQLNKNDPTYFANILFVLDGDVPEKLITNVNSSRNIIKLPGEVRPEKVIYDFLLNLSADSTLWEEGIKIGFSKESIQEYGPLSNKYQGLERDKYKKWFNDNLPFIESLNVFEYWVDENKNDYNKFIEEFKKSYNSIAKRKLYPQI